MFAKDRAQLIEIITSYDDEGPAKINLLWDDGRIIEGLHYNRDSKRDIIIPANTENKDRFVEPFVEALLDKEKSFIIGIGENVLQWKVVKTFH